MRFQPTENGGRVVTGDTQFGKFRVEWSPGGEIVGHELIIRNPAPGPTIHPAARCGSCGDNGIEGLE